MEDGIPTWYCFEILMCKETAKCVAYLRLLTVLLLQTLTNVYHTLIIYFNYLLFLLSCILSKFSYLWIPFMIHHYWVRRYIYVLSEGSINLCMCVCKCIVDIYVN